MAQISVTVNGRSYAVACDDGQENHVGRLGRYVDQKVQDLAKTVGQVGDARLLLMASLLIADELSETFEALNQLKANTNKQVAEARRAALAAAPRQDPAEAAAEAALATGIDALAERIETIADRLRAPQM